MRKAHCYFYALEGRGKPLKKMILAVLVIISIIISMNILLNNKPPKPTVTIGNSVLKVAAASYCWQGMVSNECVDTISPSELIKNQKIQPTTVSSGAVLNIKYKKKPEKDSIYVSLWKNNQQNKSVHLVKNEFSVPKEKGIYIYFISASWEKGSAAHVFTLEVK